MSHFVTLQKNKPWIVILNGSLWHVFCRCASTAEAPWWAELAMCLRIPKRGETAIQAETRRCTIHRSRYDTHYSTQVFFSSAGLARKVSSSAGLVSISGVTRYVMPRRLAFDSHIVRNGREVRGQDQTSEMK